MFIIQSTLALFRVAMVLAILSSTGCGLISGKSQEPKVLFRSTESVQVSALDQETVQILYQKPVCENGFEGTEDESVILPRGVLCIKDSPGIVVPLLHRVIDNLGLILSILTSIGN